MNTQLLFLTFFRILLSIRALLSKKIFSHSLPNEPFIHTKNTYSNLNIHGYLFFEILY